MESQRPGVSGDLCSAISAGGFRVGAGLRAYRGYRLLREEWGSILGKVVKVSVPFGSVGLCERGGGEIRQWRPVQKSVREFFSDQVLMEGF